MIAVAGDEQVIGCDGAGPPGGVKFLPDRDIGVTRRRHHGGVPGARLPHRRGSRHAAAGQCEAGKEQGSKAAAHLIRPQKKKSVDASVFTLVRMISMSAVPLPSTSAKMCALPPVTS